MRFCAWERHRRSSPDMQTCMARWLCNVSLSGTFRQSGLCSLHAYCGVQLIILTVLGMSPGCRDEDMASMVAACPALTDLDLGGCPLLTSAAVRALAGLLLHRRSSGSAKDLASPSGRSGSNAGLAGACDSHVGPGLPGLRRLSLSKCRQVDNVGCLVRLTQLRCARAEGPHCHNVSACSSL